MVTNLQNTLNHLYRKHSLSQAKLEVVSVFSVIIIIVFHQVLCEMTDNMGKMHLLVVEFLVILIRTSVY